MYIGKINSYLSKLSKICFQGGKKPTKPIIFFLQKERGVYATSHFSYDGFVISNHRTTIKRRSLIGITAFTFLFKIIICFLNHKMTRASATVFVCWLCIFVPISIFMYLHYVVIKLRVDLTLYLALLRWNACGVFFIFLFVCLVLLLLFFQMIQSRGFAMKVV